MALSLQLMVGNQKQAMEQFTEAINLRDGVYAQARVLGQGSEFILQAHEDEPCRVCDVM